MHHVLYNKRTYIDFSAHVFREDLTFLYSYFDDNSKKIAIVKNGPDMKRIPFKWKFGDDYSNWPDNKMDVTFGMPFIIPRASSVPAFMSGSLPYTIRASITFKSISRQNKSVKKAPVNQCTEGNAMQ